MGSLEVCVLNDTLTQRLHRDWHQDFHRARSGFQPRQEQKLLHQAAELASFTLQPRQFRADAREMFPGNHFTG